jgi:hypothetical protein
VCSVLLTCEWEAERVRGRKEETLMGLGQNIRQLARPNSAHSLAGRPHSLDGRLIATRRWLFGRSGFWMVWPSQRPWLNS